MYETLNILFTSFLTAGYFSLYLGLWRILYYVFRSFILVKLPIIFLSRITRIAVSFVIFKIFQTFKFYNLTKSKFRHFLSSVIVRRPIKCRAENWSLKEKRMDGEGGRRENGKDRGFLTTSTFISHHWGFIVTLLFLSDSAALSCP